MRHIDTAPDGRVAVACQYEGPADAMVPLVAIAGPGGLQPLSLPEPLRRRARQYVGSVAFDRSGRFIAASAPKGGMVLFFDATTQSFLDPVELRDGCGIAGGFEPATFVLTSGIGELTTVSLASGSAVTTERRRVPGSLFDNHASGSNQALGA